MTGFSAREFRDGLGRFATGVCIVTAEVDDTRLGATISSFNSVSLDPPLILFSLSRSAFSFPLWSRVKTFGVTVLAEDQIELSNQFARGTTGKWDDAPLSRGRFGNLLIDGGIASFECEKYSSCDGGDHEIILGRVLSFATAETAPLIFFRGRYGRLHAEELVESPAGTEFLLHGW
jgi:flavin reductase (DIM6/NTAB) family NADH-FMN oxidoreductase RutF